MKDLVFIGIDQTGAVNSKGVPHFLPVCVLRRSNIEFFYLRSLSRKELDQTLKTSPDETILVCVDCVLGLPLELKISWRQALQLISLHEGYGMAIAKKFFAKLGSGERPRRRVEVLCNANSVFTEKPFQKNIQTGTFRIWKEVSLNPKDFYVPALERAKAKNQIPLFEGYPSLSWRELFGTLNREPKCLTALMRSNFKDLRWTKKHQHMIDSDVNLADALVLALALRKNFNSALKRKKHPEGWILGAKESK